MTTPAIRSYSLTYAETSRVLQLVALGAAATLALMIGALFGGLPEWAFWLALIAGVAGVFGLGVWATLPVQVLLSTKGLKLFPARRYAPYGLPSDWVGWKEVSAVEAFENEYGYQIVITARQHSYRLAGKTTAAKECFAAAERYWLEARATQWDAASS